MSIRRLLVNILRRKKFCVTLLQKTEGNFVLIVFSFNIAQFKIFFSYFATRRNMYKYCISQNLLKIAA